MKDVKGEVKFYLQGLEFCVRKTHNIFGQELHVWHASNPLDAREVWTYSGPESSKDILLQDKPIELLAQRRFDGSFDREQIRVQTEALVLTLRRLV